MAYLLDIEGRLDLGDRLGEVALQLRLVDGVSDWAGHGGQKTLTRITENGGIRQNPK